MKISKKKSISLFILFLATIIVSVFGAQSLAKYVFEIQHEAIGHYVDYRLSHDGEGKSAIVQEITAETSEDSSYSYNYVGFISLSVNNFIYSNGEELISKRDIQFSLRTPTKDELEAGLVKDAWQDEFPIEATSGNYEVTILGELGNVLDSESDEYKDLTNFPADVKKTSHITLMIRRRTTAKQNNGALGELSEVEKISIILNTTLPYRDVEVFNISVTNRLVMILPITTTYFGFESVDLEVLTANKFISSIDGTQKRTSKNVKIIIELSNFMFDEQRFIASTKGNYKKLSSAPSNANYTENSYYLVKNSSGVLTQLVLFVPAASSLKLNFYKMEQSPYSITCKAYFMFEGDSEESDYSSYIAGPDANGKVY